MLIRLCVVLALCLGSAASEARAQDLVPVSDWVLEPGARADERGGTFVVRRGVVRTARLHSNFVLQFDFRAMDESTEASLWVRSRFGYGEARHEPIGYRVQLLAGRSKKPIGQLTRARASMRLDESLDLARPESAGEWRSVAISVEGERLTLSVDRVVVARAGELDLSTGYVAFEVVRGNGVEIRNIRTIRFPWAAEPFAEGNAARAGSDPGLSIPVLLAEVTPFYPREPFDKKLSGTVSLEGVIQVDGSVGDIRVTRSLHVDLDESAMAHLRRWKFKPAMKNRQPVAFIATFEMDFKLF